MCQNIQFPQVDPDTQLEQMLDSPQQQSLRNSRRKADLITRNTEKFIHNAALFSAGIIFLWVLLEVLGY